MLSQLSSGLSRHFIESQNGLGLEGTLKTIQFQSPTMEGDAFH